MYNFYKVNSNFTESECKSLKELMKRKDLVIQKCDKVNTVIITHQENFLKGMKSLILNNAKFIPLNVSG